MALTADDVNYLVFRYLQEAGFVHAAYAFGAESAVQKLDLDHDEFEPGILVRLIQKGLQYLELEANLQEDGTAIDENFQVLTATDILRSKNAAELRSIARQQRDEREQTPEQEKPAPAIPVEQTITLQGHQGLVFAVAWNPAGTHLVTASSDATGRLWDVRSVSGASASPPVHVLQHTPDPHFRDITTADWSPDGRFVATGGYDGTRVWTCSGGLHKALTGHELATYCIKYSPDGKMLLSGSVDHSAILFDPDTGAILEHLRTHTAGLIDVAWSGSSTFATCSADGDTHVFRLRRDARRARTVCERIRTLRGHTNEINEVQWSPDGKLLATCSDDWTAKLWNQLQDGPLCTLVDSDLKEAESGGLPRSHAQEVYNCRFRPAGPGSANPGMRPVLATASFDTTVKLWDCESGALLHKLEAHSKSIYTIDFSPDGAYLASGGHDDLVVVWDVGEGTVVKAFRTTGGAFDVAWHKDCRRLAVATSRAVHLLDLNA